MKLASALLASAAFCLFSATTQASEKPLTSTEVEALVKKVIAEHPELLIQSLNSYSNKENLAAAGKAKEKIGTLQSELKHDAFSPIAGNPHGEVTVVEFFDYHCGYCKHFYPLISQLIDEDKNVRVIFKEYPILSEDSELAAKAALAVNSIDPKKYFGFHSALMKASGHFDMEMLTGVAREAGIDEGDFKKAMDNPGIDKEIQHTRQLAQSLQINGTPAIIIGTSLIPGAIGMDELKAKVAQEHDKAKKS
jgi:protein-disulfide isomerase